VAGREQLSGQLDEVLSSAVNRRIAAGLAAGGDRSRSAVPTPLAWIVPAYGGR
jgi:hypothetical protein